MPFWDAVWKCTWLYNPGLTRMTSGEKNSWRRHSMTTGIIRTITRGDPCTVNIDELRLSVLQQGHSMPIGLCLGARHTVRHAALAVLSFQLQTLLSPEHFLLLR